MEPRAGAVKASGLATSGLELRNGNCGTNFGTKLRDETAVKRRWNTQCKPPFRSLVPKFCPGLLSRSFVPPLQFRRCSFRHRGVQARGLRNEVVPLGDACGAVRGDAVVLERAL